MLRIDLVELARAGRVEVEARVPPDSDLWAGTGLTLAGPVRVELEAQMAGTDVVVRGTFSGEVRLACRRCLKAVVAPVAEDVAFLYQEASERDASDDETYMLPERGHELDVGEAVREHVLLAVPRYVECRDECRGLCPMCGKDLNEGPCDCETDEVDERWAPLRQLKGED